MNSLCTIGRYNDLPMVTLWNTLVKFKDIEIKGMTPLKDVLVHMEETGDREIFLLWAGRQNQLTEYAATPENVWKYWGILLLLLVVFAILAVIALEFIDRDKR